MVSVSLVGFLASLSMEDIVSVFLLTSLPLLKSMLFLSLAAKFMYAMIIPCCNQCTVL